MDKRNETALNLMSRLEQMELINREEIDVEKYNKI